MLSKILYRVTANRPMRLITIDGAPYLERYYMATVFERQIWLHRFVRNDYERNVHCHPWGAYFLILCGGYTEAIGHIVRGAMLHTYETHKAPAINHIPAEKKHRIIEVEPGTWTLGLIGKRTGRKWWFYEDTPEGIVKTQPYASTGDDWWKKAKPRAQVYASMGLSAA